MKKTPKTIKPGHLDGRRGDWYRRLVLNGCVWHQHMEDATSEKGIVTRSDVVGLELVSTMAHWWLDKEIKRPDLQQEDWDFRIPRDGDSGPLVRLDHKIVAEKGDYQPHAWQLTWAWAYECWREWQPWSDFEQWRKKWQAEVKRLRDRSNDWIRGPITKEQAEQIAAEETSQLPLWILRDFADYFPETPWVKIPAKKRRTLKDVLPPGSGPISLEGSLLALKKPDAGSPGLPPIPERLRIQQGSVFSLRHPDSNNEAEQALYAEYQEKRDEALQRQREWLDAPGLYRDEVVSELSPGQFVGTYLIRISWYHTDEDLKEGFAAWLKKKESELGAAGCRLRFEMTGRNKRYADLKQLGALRLWRVMKPEAAVGGTMPFKHKSSLLDAKNKADLNLAGFFGVV